MGVGKLTQLPGLERLGPWDHAARRRYPCQRPSDDEHIAGPWDKRRATGARRSFALLVITPTPRLPLD